MIAGFEFIHVVPMAIAFSSTYEGRNGWRGTLRNTEILTIRDGKLLEAEVYFGWSIAHEAPEGGFTKPNGSGPSGP